MIYNDLADIMLHDSNNWQPNGFDLFIPRLTTPTWWLLWSSSLSSYLALGITIYLCHRHRSAGPLLPFLSTATTAKKIPLNLRYGHVATTALPAFNATQFQPTAPTSYAVVIDLLTVVLLALFAIAFLAFYICSMQSSKTKLHIVLEIGSSVECVRVSCVLLKSVLYAYRFTATSYIEAMLTTGFCPNYLLIDWPTFTATHVAKNQTFPFPPKVRITPWMRRRSRRILLTPDFYVLPLLHFNGNYRLLDLSAPEDCLREMSVSVGATESTSTVERNPSQQAVAVSMPLTSFQSTSQLATP